MFDRRVKRSGVKRIRFHDLRHTHATIGLRAGVPVKVMSERLGPATPAFTPQHYAHVIPDMQAEAAQAIADLIADVPVIPAVTDDVRNGARLIPTNTIVDATGAPETTGDKR